jgi:hypothetical protein
MPPPVLALNNTDNWPASMYAIGSGSSVASSPTTTETNAIPAPSQTASNAAKPWHPDSPMLWVAGLIALGFGLAGFSTSTSARIGKGTAGIDLHVGDAK